MCTFGKLSLQIARWDAKGKKRKDANKEDSQFTKGDANSAVGLFRPGSIC